MTNPDDIYFPQYSAETTDWLSSFNEDSQKRMRNAIINASKAAEKYCDENTDANARHLFREFIPAIVLNKNGFFFEYEKKSDDKKPDWIDNKSKILMESFTYERGGSTPFMNRVQVIISEKCCKYANIIVKNSYRFIIAIYIDFLSDVLLDEIRECNEVFHPIFLGNKSLSAILFFSEDSKSQNKKQHYEFFCLTVDPSLKNMNKWPFTTENLKS